MCDLRASVLLAEEVGAVLGAGAALQRGVPEGSGEAGRTGVAMNTHTHVPDLARDEDAGGHAVTGLARSVGASVSPVVATVLVESVEWASVPFFLAGGLKFVYDVLLYRAFAGSTGRTDTK